MVAGVRRDLLAAGLAVFDRDGFEGATVAAIRTQARASNGSFFHFFGSKKELAGTLFLEVLQRYHAAMLAAIDTSLSARAGIGRLIRAHLDWVVNNRREARYLFEISRSEWTEDLRDAQRAQNSHLAEGIKAWCAPLIARGELLPMTPTLFFSQIIGPAQIFCRAWLSGRDRADPRDQTDVLIACATRAVVASNAGNTTGETARLRSTVGRSCCSSTACFTVASPRSWSTMRPPSRRRPRAVSRRSRRNIS